jgi:hypothetical protein
LREILSRTWSIYVRRNLINIFLFSPNAGAELFEVDEKHVF